MNIIDLLKTKVKELILLKSPELELKPTDIYYLSEFNDLNKHEDFVIQFIVILSWNESL